MLCSPQQLVMVLLPNLHLTVELVAVAVVVVVVVVVTVVIDSPVQTGRLVLPVLQTRGGLVRTLLLKLRGLVRILEILPRLRDLMRIPLPMLHSTIVVLVVAVVVVVVVVAVVQAVRFFPTVL